MAAIVDDGRITVLYLMQSHRIEQDGDDDDDGIGLEW